MKFHIYISLKNLVAIAKS